MNSLATNCSAELSKGTQLKAHFNHFVESVVLHERAKFVNLIDISIELMSAILGLMEIIFAKYLQNSPQIWLKFHEYPQNFIKIWT